MMMMMMMMMMFPSFPQKNITNNITTIIPVLGRPAEKIQKILLQQQNQQPTDDDDDDDFFPFSP